MILRNLLAVAFLLTVMQVTAQGIAAIPVHDPVIIRQDSFYYIFCTGQGISRWRSSDMRHWERETPVFSHPPQWAVDAVPGFKGHIWAPDISLHDGKYFLFYAVSSFGKNSSCIGLAVNKTLHEGSPGYKWEDLGMVIRSVPGRDMWNAIDPNQVDDEQGSHWLAFGSFWEGIKLVRLGNDLRSVDRPEQWYSLAKREREFGTPDSSAGNAAIEAPFIYRKNGFYYLFVSFDYCCRAEKSNYKIMVGRAKCIQGPYIDRKGLPMLKGGGSVLLQGDRNWYGVGHNAVIARGGEDYLVFHAYDAADQGKAKLRIEKIIWRAGWPETAKPVDGGR